VFVTGVGSVVEVSRNVKGTKLSTIRLAQNYSGLVVEDGNYGKRDTGFFTYQVWEDNTMAGTNSTFSKTMDSIKPGTTLEILAELTDRTTKVEGKTTDRRVILTAIRIGFVQTARPQDDKPKVQAAVADAKEDGFFDVTGEEEVAPEYVPDAFS